MSSTFPSGGFAQIKQKEQALALYAFLQSRWPNFGQHQALDVIQKLKLVPGTAPKAVAKQLADLLKTCRVHLKHTASLQAASRILGFESWHTVPDDVGKTLGVTIFDHGLEQIDKEGWSDAGAAVAVWLRQFNWANSPERIVDLRCSPHVLGLWTPTPQADDRPPFDLQPGALVSPLDTQSRSWMDGSLSTLKSWRGVLEDGGLALLDGFAPLALAASDSASEIALRGGDAELVLLFQEHETSVLWEEASRGNEFACWQALTNHAAEERTRVTVQSDGTWLVGSRTYRWEFSLVADGAVMSDIRIRSLTADESSELFRRYRLARRILRDTALTGPARPKWLSSHEGTPSTLPITKAFFRALEEHSVDWKEFAPDETWSPATATSIPFGNFFAAVQRLPGVNPNELIERPTLKSMKLLNSGSELRAVLFRVDRIEAVLDSSLDEEQQAIIKKHVTALRSAIRAFSQLGVRSFAEMKDLAPLNADADAAAKAFRGHGLAAFMTVRPWFAQSTAEAVSAHGLPPLSFGRSLMLRFVASDTFMKSGALSDPLKSTGPKQRYYVHGDRAEHDLGLCYCAQCDVFWPPEHFLREHGAATYNRYFSSLEGWRKRNSLVKRGYRRPSHPENVLKKAAMDSRHDFENSRSAFHKWLGAQLKRNDPVGDVARDVISDRDFPVSAATYNEVRSYISRRSAATGLRRAVRESWREFESTGQLL